MLATFYCVAGIGVEPMTLGGMSATKAPSGGVRHIGNSRNCDWHPTSNCSRCAKHDSASPQEHHDDQCRNYRVFRKKCCVIEVLDDKNQRQGKIRTDEHQQ